MAAGSRARASLIAQALVSTVNTARWRTRMEPCQHLVRSVTTLRLFAARFTTEAALPCRTRQTRFR